MDNLSLKSFFNDIYFLIIAYVYYLFNIPFKATIIVGVDAEYGGIGMEGSLPWKLKSDMQHFKKTTSSKNKNKRCKNILICGRLTYDSLGGLTILPKRNMIVISKNIEYEKDVLTQCSTKIKYLNSATKIYYLNTGEKLIFISDIRKIDNVISYLSYEEFGIPKIFVMGGAKIYDMFLGNDVPRIKLDKCLITSIYPESQVFKSSFNRRYDTFFPFLKLKKNFKQVKQKELEPGVILQTYIRKK